MIPQLAPRDLAAWRADAGREPPFLLDVREPWEFAHCHIEGSVLVPLQTLPTCLEELPRNRDVVVICHHGNRSQVAAQWLERAGYTQLHNLRGGVAAWADDVDPQMPRY